MERQRFVITGGSSGIGLESARLAVQDGHEVVLVARSQERLDHAAQQIGGRVTTAVVDVTNEHDVEHFFSFSPEFDHLITAAGDKAVDAAQRDVDTAVARRVFEVKYWGQYFAVKYGAPRIRTGGSIVMFSAWLARKPTAGFPTYAAIDGAVESLARTLMLELAPIRVNVLAPGVIDTPLYDNLDAETRRAVFSQVASRLPLGRIGTAAECARAVDFLTKAAYANGTVLDIDGGWS
jgi:NAD(P)-dependent dehydrogenase (short-subunit alcohol dehydrogenase family)